MLTSISYHGVTTALMGNCSICFAPVKREDHRLLAEMMESVEKGIQATRRAAGRRRASGGRD
jgi:N-acyl-D-aspartate/D-glutamate deacylase